MSLFILSLSCQGHSPLNLPKWCDTLQVALESFHRPGATPGASEKLFVPAFLIMPFVLLHVAGQGYLSQGCANAVDLLHLGSVSRMYDSVMCIWTSRAWSSGFRCHPSQLSDLDIQAPREWVLDGLGIFS